MISHIHLFSIIIFPIISKASSNFQDGCSTIAAKITSLGVTTAANASPTDISTNINTLSTNRYDSGYTDGSNSTKLTFVAGAWFALSGDVGFRTVTKQYTIPSGKQPLVICKKIYLGMKGGTGWIGERTYDYSLSGNRLTVNAYCVWYDSGDTKCGWYPYLEIYYY